MRNRELLQWMSFLIGPAVGLGAGVVVSGFMESPSAQALVAVTVATLTLLGGWIAVNYRLHRHRIRGAKVHGGLVKLNEWGSVSPDEGHPLWNISVWLGSEHSEGVRVRADAELYDARGTWTSLEGLRASLRLARRGPSTVEFAVPSNGDFRGNPELNLSVLGLEPIRITDVEPCPEPTDAKAPPRKWLLTPLRRTR